MSSDVGSGTQRKKPVGAKYPKFDDSAICTQVDPEMFFPEYPTPEQNERIKSVCHPCPWLEACLEYAVLTDVIGIWGGTTYAERRAIRKKRGIRPAQWYLAFGETEGYCNE